eukprot:TRINITY_DN5921_c0_g1_i1.p2 TRINITY_DN5921_c0_g1~~TRINITY_DN5921_c0_g1_i1.p2  ORF type:complete len:102 (-),score=17.19 TRINITY_DN5921_c0_g1_i1:13-318(-)
MAGVEVQRYTTTSSDGKFVIEETLTYDRSGGCATTVKKKYELKEVLTGRSLMVKEGSELVTMAGNDRDGFHYMNFKGTDEVEVGSYDSCDSLQWTVLPIPK